MTKFRAAPEWIAVENEKVEENMTESGIMLTQETAGELEKLKTGKLVAIGYDAKRDGLKIGDVVVFSKYAATEFEGENILILRYGDIVGTISD